MNGLHVQHRRQVPGRSGQPVEILRHSFWLGEGDTALHGLLQYPEGDVRSMLWIICPGLGIDYMNAYRGLRHLADALAADGQAVLRFDYAGTGSSADPDREADQLPLWLGSIERIQDHARGELGFERVGLIGLRFGATLAALAARDRRVHGLALWSPVTKGSQLIRETRMLRGAAEIDTEDDRLEAAGWVINAATQTAIDGIDLASFRPQAQNLLVIDGADARRTRKLVDAWSVSDRGGLRYETLDETRDLLVDAHNTRIPRETLDCLRDWARQVVGGAPVKESPRDSGSAPQARLQACLENGGERIELEETTGFTRHGLFALHCQPEHQPQEQKPLVLLLNSGSNHQVGPNRLYVTLARLLSSRGYESLRVDLPGLGETPEQPGTEENLPYMPEPMAALRQAVEDLELSSRPLILLGLCSGAYHAFLGAIELRDAKIEEALLINPLTFYWQQGMTLEDAPSVGYGEWNWYQQSARDPERWKRLLTGKINPLPILRSILGRFHTRLRTQARRVVERFERSPEDRISPSLRNSLLKIERRGLRLTLVFADTDPGLSILRDQAGSTLQAMLKRGSVCMKLISRADHTFSRMRPRTELLDWLDEHFSRQ